MSTVRFNAKILDIRGILAGVKVSSKYPIMCPRQIVISLRYA